MAPAVGRGNVAGDGRLTEVLADFKAMKLSVAAVTLYEFLPQAGYVIQGDRSHWGLRVKLTPSTKIRASGSSLLPG